MIVTLPSVRLAGFVRDGRIANGPPTGIRLTFALGSGAIFEQRIPPVPGSDQAFQRGMSHAR